MLYELYENDHHHHININIILSRACIKLVYTATDNCDHPLRSTNHETENNKLRQNWNHTARIATRIRAQMKKTTKKQTVLANNIWFFRNNLLTWVARHHTHIGGRNLGFNKIINFSTSLWCLFWAKKRFSIENYLLIMVKRVVRAPLHWCDTHKTCYSNKRSFSRPVSLSE